MPQPLTVEVPLYKVFVETYGCQMNINDSELIVGILKNNGYDVAESLEDADVIMLNTCAIREKAELRILGRLTNLYPYKRLNPHLLIGVVGCMAKHLGESLFAKQKLVDFIVGPDKYRELPNIVNRARVEKTCEVDYDRSEVYADITPLRARAVNAWLTIQRGCGYKCSYCIVPYTRGGEANVDSDILLEQARKLAASGSDIITLLGQTVNSYNDGKRNFVQLLKAMSDIDEIRQIRFVSPHPRGFNDELIELITHDEKLASFVHLPLQSASNQVLKRMRRPYTIEHYDSIVEKLRSGPKNIAITTDIIVGFCGESDADYLETRDYMIKTRFESAFLFAYSERDPSPASQTLEDDVPADVKQQRLADIIAVQEKITLEKYRSRIGTTQSVIVESLSSRDGNHAFGNTPDFVNVLISGDDSAPIAPGDKVEVLVENANGRNLFAKYLRTVDNARVPVQPQRHENVGISLGPA